MEPKAKTKVEEIEPKVEIVIKAENTQTDMPINDEGDAKEESKYFQCSSCTFKEKYEYFGKNPIQVKNYLLLEDAYVIEDPFLPPKQGKIIILGAHCLKCRKGVCKDVNCSLYYGGTYCIQCAKLNIKRFPLVVQEKLNRIVTN